MRSVRRPLVIVALCFAFAFVPVASQAAARTAPLSLPPAFDLEAVLGNTLSAIQSFMSKILVSGGGDDGTTSTTTPSTPATGTGTPPDGSGENGPGIDPNG